MVNLLLEARVLHRLSRPRGGDTDCEPHPGAILETGRTRTGLGNMQYPVSRWRKGLVPVFAVIHDSRMLTKEKEKEARRYEESGPWP